MYTNDLSWLVVRHQGLRFIAAVSLLAPLAACQIGKSSSLTMEEARGITAQFQTTDYAPPPRTINDIRDAIGEFPEIPKNCAVRQKERFEVNKLVIKSTHMLETRRERNTWATSVTREVTTEFARGNFKTAIESLKRAMAYLAESGSESRAVHFYAHLTWFNAAIGNTATAQTNFEDYSRIWNGMFLHSISADGRRRFNFGSAVARAALAKSNGELLTAEKFLRRALGYLGSGSSDVMARHYIDRRKRLLTPGIPDSELGEIRLHYDKQNIAAELAANLLRQGRLAEAELVARKEIKPMFGPSFNSFTALDAQPVAQLAAILREQDRLDDAEYVARVAVRMHEVDCSVANSIAFVSARRALAGVLADKGDWMGVLEEIEMARLALVDSPETFEHLFVGMVEWGLALVHTGRAEEGLKRLKETLERAIKTAGADSYATAESRGHLAVAHAALGAKDEALAEFSAAFPVLVEKRNHETESTGGKSRATRVTRILEAYMDLLFELTSERAPKDYGIDAAAEMLRVASIARSGTVQWALNAAAARAASGDQALTNLVRREQDAAQEMSIVLDTLTNLSAAPRTQVDHSTKLRLEIRVKELRAARATLSATIHERFPDYANLINPKPATVEQARAALRPGEALIATYVVEDRTYVWAIPKQGPIAFTAADIGRENLADTVALLRSALEPNAQTLGDIPDFDVVAAYGLYEQLLKPVEAGWKRAKSLLVVADGALSYLPLSVLPTEPAKLGGEVEPLFANYREMPWLARTHAVTMLPSVASLKTLRGLPPGDNKRLAFAGFGDPWFSAEQAASAALPKAPPQQVAALISRGIRTRGLPVRLRAAPKTQDLDSAELARLPRLPDTADEVKSIAVALNASLTESVFLGREANEGLIKSLDLSGYKVLAFATHGLVPGDLNGLTQPALAMSAPDVANDPDNDGLLTMGEILGLKLDADWVVLSACNTASGEGAGAEAVSGLGRAFFYAGTRALLVSNWPVETTSAKVLTTDLFKRQAANDNLTRAEALRHSMNALIDGPGYVDPESGKTVFSYAHPLFWAPFSLIGDGGGSRPVS